MNHAIGISLDDKWTRPKGRIFLSGTQAIARVLLAQAELDRRAGLNTAGYISGYRGSPLGNVDTALWSVKDRLADAGVVFQPGVNEDIAATAVAGTQQFDQLPGARYEGVFAAWYGKGPGVDRSGDAFKHGNYAGAHAKGGVLIFFGDDHAGKSSTVAFQSEQAIVASSIPILYPADPGELIEYGLFGYALSRHSGSWVSIKCVNEIVEQTGTFDIDFDGFAATLPGLPPPPPEGIHARRRAFSPLRDEQIVNEHRMPLIGPFIRANRIDRTIFRGSAPRLGLVAAGKSYGDTRQALEILGLDEDACHGLGVALYKPGCIWPLEAEGLVEFSEGLHSLFVIEEKKAFVEIQAASIFINRDGAPRIIGKRDEAGRTIFSETISLEPAAIALAICDRLELLAPLPAHLTEIRNRLRDKSGSVPIPLDVRRAPFFCSGCPHTRSTRIPEGSHAMSGIGCHGMVSFVRPEETLTPMQMGAEGANWLGMAPFTDLPHIFQNMGDGTYYHSGLLAIRAAVASGANITYKILYNDAVAMTGGQPVDGPLSVAEIAQQLRHEGVGRIVVLSDNPDYHRQTGGFPEGVAIGHRDTLDAVQRELREITGVTGLIYEQTCAAEKRRRRKRGTFPNPAKRMFIAHQVCEGCGDCSEQSSCVSIAPRETELGRKRMIDQSSCNKDFSCNRGFCPSFITVYDAEPRKPEGVAIDESWFGDIPAPVPAALGSESFNLMVAGIGGTGVITVGALLGMAAHIDGKAASLFDMTGLAQKNGAVYSHIRIAETPEAIRTQRIGAREADLLVAFDMVAALAPEALNSLAEGRTKAIANIDVSPTAALQRDRDFRLEPDVLHARLARAIGSGAVHTAGASDLALKLTGDTISANLMMVGIALQRGLLPVTLAAVEKAVALNGVAIAQNLKALALGRLIAAHPERVAAALAKGERPASELPRDLPAIVAHRAAHLARYQDEALAARYRDLVDRVGAAERSADPASTAIATIVANNYAKVLAIKDEYEVARLLTDPALRAELDATFASGGRIAFNLAPPIFGGAGPGERPRKREFPAWIMMPALRVLSLGKAIRGSWIDPFARTAERRDERRLASDYAALVERMISRMGELDREAVAKLLDRVRDVRGFGPVKRDAMDRYFAEIGPAEAGVAPAASRARDVLTID